ncbi:MAG: hypothetical protein G3M78_06085 [Candidatus Nitrohelix vancouverensis]|uniref:Uncharacterized protein n=1 Tax=Candidatus Nitrohelix vancouverensis TaxID=2705534 RepID=A0A7T0C1X0_9BACT|nr:MAG: hypothetical protein G3M78_06085 [Candidatus Nitrohelix vancouverensis]
MLIAVGFLYADDLQKFEKDKPSAQDRYRMRTLITLFLTIGSIFWVLVGALSGDLKSSAIYIASAWAIYLVAFSAHDLLRKKEAPYDENE